MNKEIKIGDYVLFPAENIADMRFLAIVTKILPPRSHKYMYIDEPVVCLLVYNDPIPWERRLSDVKQISEGEAMLRILSEIA